MNKWVWVTPLVWNGHDYKFSDCEVLINLDKVKQITRDRGDRYTVWFIGEGHQDTLYINKAGFNTIEQAIESQTRNP